MSQQEPTLINCYSEDSLKFEDEESGDDDLGDDITSSHEFMSEIRFDHLKDEGQEVEERRQSQNPKNQFQNFALD